MLSLVRLSFALFSGVLNLCSTSLRLTGAAGSPPHTPSLFSLTETPIQTFSEAQSRYRSERLTIPSISRT